MENNSWSYVKKGFSLSFNGIVKKKKNYFKYMIFMMAYILSSLCIFAYPIFSLANHKINKMIINERDVNIFDSFDNVEKSKKYSKFLFILLISIFIISGVLLIILLMCFCLELLFSVIFTQSVTNINNSLIIFTSILFSIGLTCVTIYVNIRLLPLPIIINDNIELNVSDTLKESFKLTKGITGKLFFINLIIFLLSLLYILIVYLILCFALNVIVSNYVGGCIIIFFDILLMIFYVLLLPIMFLANNVSTTLVIYKNSNLDTNIESTENLKIVEALLNDLEESNNE